MNHRDQVDDGRGCGGYRGFPGDRYGIGEGDCAINQGGGTGFGANGHGFGYGEGEGSRLGSGSGDDSWMMRGDKNDI